MADRNPLEKGLAEIEKITSLETARMTLRWALEKIRTLEQGLATAETRARDLLSRDIAAANIENPRLKSTIARLEEQLARYAREGVDPVRLARLEGDLVRRGDELRRQQEVALENARKERELIASEAQLAKDRALREAQLETASIREDLSNRFVELNERLVALKGREQALETRLQRQASDEERRRGELETMLAERSASIEARARELVENTLGTARADWDAERRLLLEQLADLRGSARIAMPEFVSAQRAAEDLRAENEVLRQKNNGFSEHRRRLESEINELKENLRRLTITSEDAERQAEHQRERASALERELDEEKRAHGNTRADASRAKADFEAREKALKGVEEILESRLHDAERALITHYDSWRKREESRRVKSSRWLREVEARRVQADADQAKIEQLRGALMDAIEQNRLLAAKYQYNRAAENLDSKEP